MGEVWLDLYTYEFNYSGLDEVVANCIIDKIKSEINGDVYCEVEFQKEVNARCWVYKEALHNKSAKRPSTLRKRSRRWIFKRKELEREINSFKVANNTCAVQKLFAIVTTSKLREVKMKASKANAIINRSLKGFYAINDC